MPPNSFQLLFQKLTAAETGADAGGKWEEFNSVYQSVNLSVIEVGLQGKYGQSNKAYT